ncbi:MAG: glycosyltransferase family 2 protein [Candidatus Helarchaeota archaeon]
MDSKRIKDYIISLVIPAKNESKNLPHVIPKIPDIVDDIILVDGNSTDDTIKKARDLNSNIRIVKQKSKGKGNAIIEGFKVSKGEILIALDADGSMDPKEITLYIKKINEGYDLVKGSRFLNQGRTEDMTLFRKIGNFIFVKLVNLLFRVNFTDLCYGYMGMKKSVFESLNLNSDGFNIEAEIITKAALNKFKIAEVPSIEKKRIHGISNLKAIKDGYQILRTIFKVRFS